MIMSAIWDHIVSSVSKPYHCIQCLKNHTNVQCIHNLNGPTYHTTKDYSKWPRHPGLGEEWTTFFRKDARSNPSANSKQFIERIGNETGNAHP